MTTLTLIFGNKNYSSWSLRPWVFLKQYAIPFNEKRVALFTDTTRQALAAYNSDYKVPVLQDGDFLVWDSLAILEYLSENYLDGRGWPQDTRARARARSISSEMHSSYTAVRSELPMNCRKRFRNVALSTQAQQQIDRIQSLWQQCRSEFGKNGEWLFGDYSAADAMFAPVALRFAGYSIVLNDIAQQYVQSVLNQPAIIEWMTAGKVEQEVIAEDESDAELITE